MKARIQYKGMTFFFIIIICILLIVNSMPVQATNDAPKSITISAVTSGEPKPFVFIDADKKFSGHNADLIEAIFAKLPQYNLQIETTDFPSMFAGMDTDRYQLAINNLAMNDERQEKYLFTNPIFANRYVVVTSKNNQALKKVTALSDLSGKSFIGTPGINSTTALEEYNKENPNNTIIINYTEVDLVKQLQDVESERYDFLVMDKPMYQYYQQEYNFNTEVFELTDAENLLPQSYSYLLVAKGNEQLLTDINQALREVIADGTSAKINEKYFREDYSPPLSSQIIQTASTKQQGVAKLFDLKLVFTQIPTILQYLPVTLKLSVVAMVIGWLLGLGLALARKNKIPVLSQISTVFVSFMRGTPIIVQLYLSFYGIPLILKYINATHQTNFNVNAIPAMLFAMVALGLNQAAFDSEVFRAALSSVDRGEIEAGQSLGMSNFKVFRRIIFPEAMVVALPSLGNSLIALVKGTSLAFACSVIEMTAEGKILAGSSYRYFEVYCSLAIIYWSLTLLIELIFHLVEKKIHIPEQPPQTEELMESSVEVSV